MRLSLWHIYGFLGIVFYRFFSKGELLFIQTILCHSELSTCLSSTQFWIKQSSGFLGRRLGLTGILLVYLFVDVKAIRLMLANRRPSIWVVQCELMQIGIGLWVRFPLACKLLHQIFCLSSICVLSLRYLTFIVKTLAHVFADHWQIMELLLVIKVVLVLPY